ncbi:copper-binding protein (NosD) [Kaistia soli DSM 19436]|uniref:Copper-binding protein (NosD) n=1 Tax=Kaistia soli DSM 19436 TaxID=1122133 RepID=A0A1M5G7V6_9HYPH|nr:DUF6519 domain-containing protein [Kaistia soli]SHF99847.1 copper-binding protein (NosD) [Kaistia soli DSM 19436]
MSGDYSRFTFDPRRRFAAVLMQQGRVQLDSDWNEEADLLRERVRVLGLDAGGAAWVAHLTTPNAFLIGLLAGPPADLSIGEGRLYLDGRLAEVFAGEGITYLNQPFLPDPPPFNPAVDTLVYLDMWEREVSWAEDSRLLDVALGGVDTTTRIQQVWQVKRVEPGNPAACGVDLDALFPPSAGRLTTSAVAPPAPDDPCVLPPNAGYRGIENRLYRVEVQVGGPLGTARFKWSRDNGSIVSRVSAIAVAGGQSQIKVNRIGRDEVLRFTVGDWVTLTDDYRELNGESGQMARVVDIDEAQRIVTLDRAVPTAGRPFGPTAADITSRNTRLQRWDEQAPANVLDADGLMTTAAGPLDLEDGVQVSFSVSPAGGSFHVGDYWVFAARTADASVEVLAQAPPRGIRHQYLQLAAIPAGATPSDCRPPPPSSGEGCCTFVVHPGEDIQAAIDALPPEGGCVCLKAGLHLIESPLVLQKDNVSLHGESLGAILYNRRGTGLLIVSQALHDRVHDLVFRQGEAGAQPVIQIEGAEDFGLSDCRIEMFARRDSVGLFAVASTGIDIANCTIGTPNIGLWFEKGCADVSVTGCALDMPGDQEDQTTNVAIVAREMRGFLTIENNIITAAINGIIVNDNAAGPPRSRARLPRISGNRIQLGVNRQDETAFGIDVAAPNAIVNNNQLIYREGRLIGIRLCGSGSSCTDNVCIARTREVGLTVAIVAGDETDGKFLPLERIAISGNILEGPQHGIVLAGVAHADVSANLLGRSAVPFGLGITLNQSTDTMVSDNHILEPTFGIFAMSGARNCLRQNRIDGGNFGIGIALEEAPSVTECRLTDLDRGGILMLATTQRSTIVENRLIRCGGGVDRAVAIGALIVFGEWHVEANEVMDTGLSADKAGPVAAIAYGIRGLYVLEARIASNLVTYSDASTRDPAAEDRALLMQGLLDYIIDFGDRRLEIGFPVQICDNKFIGTGATALVELLERQINDRIYLRFERVMVSGNYCAHVTANGNQQSATVHLLGRALTISSNQIKATTPGFPSWQLNGRRGPFIGNISNGPTLGRAPANQFPSPENAFNMIV